MLRKEVKNKILALDYDGVIANSKLECLSVGFNAYLKLNKSTKLFNGEKLTFDNFKILISKNKKILEKYKKLRPYVIDAFCWYVILYVIERNIKIKNQKHYNEMRKSLMHLYSKYVKYFYNERGSLQNSDFNKWLKLIKPYKIINSIKKLNKKYIISIATNNRKESIKGFLQKYKIPVEFIADSTISIDKVKQLEFIKNKYNAEFSDICFVDDQVAHFPTLVRLNVKCFLATWGYNNKEQRKIAKKLKVCLVSERNFYRVLSSQNGKTI